MIQLLCSHGTPVTIVLACGSHLINSQLRDPLSLDAMYMLYQRFLTALLQAEGAADSSERHADLEGCIHIMVCGYAALAASDYAAAAVHFTSLTGLLPDNLHALLSAAQALAGKGDTSAALGGCPVPKRPKFSKKKSLLCTDLRE